MTPNQSTWTAVLGAVGAALVPLAILGRFALRYVRRFFALFDHERRIKMLENTAATGVQLATLGTELRRLHEEHKAEDAAAFGNLNHDVGAVRDHMARADDLKRVEDKLDRLLVDGFRRT